MFGCRLFDENVQHVDSEPKFTQPKGPHFDQHTEFTLGSLLRQPAFPSAHCEDASRLCFKL